MASNKQDSAESNQPRYPVMQLPHFLNTGMNQQFICFPTESKKKKKKQQEKTIENTSKVIWQTNASLGCGTVTEPRQKTLLDIDLACPPQLKVLVFHRRIGAAGPKAYKSPLLLQQVCCSDNSPCWTWNFNGCWHRQHFQLPIDAATVKWFNDWNEQVLLVVSEKYNLG